MAVETGERIAGHEKASHFLPVGQLHLATFNFSGRLDASGWDKAAQAYVGALQWLTQGLKHAGRSLDGRVVSINAKRWRDEGAEIVAARHSEYVKARASLLAAKTTDPENIAGKVRLVAEMLGLPDPWSTWTDDRLPPSGSREAEAFTPVAVALATIYRDLRKLPIVAQERSTKKKGAKRGNRKD